MEREISVHIAPGTYVVAVSGGVDSMVLLDILSQIADLRLIVAHVNHGIRDDSWEDQALVRETARRYGLQYFDIELHLGKDASEARARLERYTFLERVCEEQGAVAIITAHHEDDLLETMFLNIVRGTYRHGLTSLQNRPKLLRPLLHVNKDMIRSYATRHGIEWREDSTNADERYTRNYIRLNLMPHMSAQKRQQLLDIHKTMLVRNAEIDDLIGEVLASMLNESGLRRQSFIMLPHAIAREVLAEWVRRCGLEVSKKRLERLVVAIKVAQAYTTHDVSSAYFMKIDRTFAQILHHSARNASV